MKKLLLLLVMMLSFVTNAQTFDFECAAAPLFRIGEVTRSIIQNRVTTLEVRGGVSEDIQWYSEASNGARTLIEDADDVTNDDISDDNRSYTILIDGPIGTRVTYLVPNGDDFIRFNINIVAPPIAPEIEVVQAIGGVNRIRVVFEGLNPTESYTTVISTGTSEIVRTPFTGNHVIDQEVSVTPVYGETFAVLLYRSSDLTTSLTDYRQPVSADPSFTVATATWNNLNEYTFRFNPVSIPRGAWIEINGNGRRIHRDNSARTIISDFFTIAGTVVLQLRGNNDTVYAEERLQLPTPGNGGIRAYINGSGFLRGAGWNVDGHIAPEGVTQQIEITPWAAVDVWDENGQKIEPREGQEWRYAIPNAMPRMSRIGSTSLATGWGGNPAWLDSYDSDRDGTRNGPGIYYIKEK